MKKKIYLFCVSLVISTMAFLSCKKEYSCEGCGTDPIQNELNTPPIAIAGPDQVITLPTDSILLDGSSSSDPDGTISDWLWNKISGPASFNVNADTASKTKVNKLVAGSYQFELKIKDNGGLFTNDTVMIIVNDPAANQPPIADAGADTTITLPSNTTILDGSMSTDPDNNIASYKWLKVSGPSSFNIANAGAVQTHVTNLVEGVYEFELKITDAGGLSDKDTIRLII